MPTWLFWGMVAGQWLAVVTTIALIGEERKPITKTSAVIQLAAAIALTVILYLYGGVF